MVHVRLEIDSADRLLLGRDAIEDALLVAVAVIAAGFGARRDFYGIVRVAQFSVQVAS